MIKHPKFTAQRYRALKEVSEGVVQHYVIDKRDHWLVGGAKVNPQTYDWLREKSLITLGLADNRLLTEANWTKVVKLTSRGEEALARENEKAAKRETDRLSHAAKTDAARRANAAKRDK